MKTAEDAEDTEDLEKCFAAFQISKMTAGTGVFFSSIPASSESSAVFILPLDLSPDRWRNHPQLIHQFRELLWCQRLCSIGPRLIGRAVYFDQQRVGACCH
jgi:hypothetical protein